MKPHTDREPVGRPSTSRRMFLRGVGVTMALPWLESAPSRGADAAAPGDAAPCPKRFAAVFMGCGVNPNQWWARGSGAAMELGRCLEPLEPLKAKINVVDGLFNRHATGVGIHPGQTGNILSGAALKKGAELKGGISVDQMLAKHLGEETVQPSIVLGCEQPITGYHETNFSMAYSSHISWQSATSPVPMEVYPSLAFDGLFDNRGSLRNRSILDRVREEADGLSRRVSLADRAKLDEYLTSVRDVERRASAMRAAKQTADDRASDRGRPARLMPRPDDGLPEDVREHMRLMADLIALGFQTDKTRIATLLLCRDISGMFYPFLGVRAAHHSASHDDTSESYERVTRYYVEQFAYLASRLDAMPEGEGTVLDNTCLLFTNSLWSGTRHDASKVPVVLAGGLGGTLETGRVLDYADRGDDGRKLCSMYLGIMDRMGVALDRFGDAEERLAGFEPGIAPAAPIRCPSGRPGRRRRSPPRRKQPGSPSPMRSTARILSVVVIVAASATLRAADEPPGRPNILLIYTDDQPYKTVGCYPEAPGWVRTPNIDRLAAEGVRFHRSYLGSWCMPSRASILTGRLPHGVESMRMAGEYPGSTYDPERAPFWPAVFRRHGYQTAQIGKWHTGTDTGLGRDWDHQIVWNRPALPDNAGNYYDDQILSFNGEERRVAGYSTDNYTRWAAEYIEGEHRDPEKPWFLWLCYGAIHGPTTPAERHRGAYAGNSAPVPDDIFGPWPEKPSYLERTRAWEAGPDGLPVMAARAPREGNFDKDEPGLDYQAWVQQANECALALDEGVGRLLDALDRTDQRSNTLVVFVADQGFALGEHGMSIKLAPYDAAIASPLIISQPGTIPEGKECRQAVNSADLVATFCSRAGIPLPWSLHGEDLSPLLSDPDSATRSRPMLMEHLGRKYGSDTATIPRGPEMYEVGGVPWWVLLRDGQFKYIRTLVEGEPEELYDLDADPEELRNLALDPGHADLLATLRDRTIAELRRTEAPFVDAMPAPRTPDRSEPARPDAVSGSN